MKYKKFLFDNSIYTIKLLFFNDLNYLENFNYYLKLIVILLTCSTIYKKANYKRQFSFNYFG